MPPLMHPERGRSAVRVLNKAVRQLARPVALLGLALLLRSAAPAAADDHPAPGAAPWAEPFGQIEALVEELREIMHLGASSPVKAKTISKAEFLALYEQRMNEQQSPREIHGEELFLKLFGFVEDDFDYQKTMLDLMGEQAWALYDFKQGTLYLSEWAPTEAREFALVHELVHAIDDQNFNLRKYVEGAKLSEQQLARLAVVEGQASWVMTEWVMSQSGKSLRGNRLLAATTATATRFEAEQFPVYESTPLYFREVLIFPYTDGLLFQHEMIERFGTDGLSRVFEQPPLTTQQILQPDLYLQGTGPDHPDLPRAALPKGFRRVYEGTFGQLDHRILLEQHLGAGDRRDLLDKWKGGRFKVFENKRTGRAVLHYAVRWADPEAAREFYNLYRQICERKWNGLELVNSSRDRCEGVGADGRVWIELEGDTVRSVEGLPSDGTGGK